MMGLRRETRILSRLVHCCLSSRPVRDKGRSTGAGPGDRGTGFNGIAALRTRLPVHHLPSSLLCNIATLIPPALSPPPLSSRFPPSAPFFCFFDVLSCLAPLFTSLLLLCNFFFFTPFF